MEEAEVQKSEADKPETQSFVGQALWSATCAVVLTLQQLFLTLSVL